MKKNDWPSTLLSPTTSPDQQTSLATELRECNVKPTVDNNDNSSQSTTHASELIIHSDWVKGSHDHQSSDHPPPSVCSVESNTNCFISLRRSIHHELEEDRDAMEALHILSEENTTLKSLCAKFESEIASLQSSLNSIQAKKRSDMGNSERFESFLIGEVQIKEQQLSQQLSRLEGDLRAEKSEGRSLRQEMDRINQEYERLESSNQSALEQLKKARAELKELKIRDLRLEEENSMLEEENVNLQSSISKLKCSLVEQESLQHENEFIQEQLVDTKAQLDDAINVKSILDKEVEELYESLKEERQLKYQLKKELASQIAQTQHRNPIISTVNYTAEQSDERDDYLSENVCSSYPEKFNSKCNELRSLISRTNINGNSSHTIEEDRFETEGYRLIGDRPLPALVTNLSLASEEVVNSDHQLTLSGNKSITTNIAQHDKTLDAISNHNRRISKLLENFTGFTGSSVMKDCQSANHSGINSSKWHLAMSNAKDDMLNELSVQDRFISSLEHKIREQFDENKSLQQFKNAYDDLLGIQNATNEILSKPVKLLVNLVEELNQFRRDSSDSETDYLEFNGNVTGIDVVSSVSTLVERLALQVRHICDNYSNLQAGSSSAGSAGDNPCGACDSSSNEELSDSNAAARCSAARAAIEGHRRYKSLLAQKRSMIATLRFIIKSDRQVAQLALANLKTKFENDKLAVTETMRALRAELKVQREQAMQFARYRALFAARGDEYAEQIDILQRNVIALTEENAMFKSLVRMAVEQKMLLSEQLAKSSSVNNGGSGGVDHT